MKIEIYDLARIVAGFQLLLISIFLITHKSGKRISHKILAVFLLSKSLVIIESTLLLFKAYLIEFPNIFCIARTSVFLFGPSSYFYARSIAFRDFKFKKEHAIHLIPFFAYCVFFIFKFHIQSTEIKQQLILQRFIYTYNEALIIFSLLNVQVLVYIIASLFVLKNYRFELKKAYSSVERINLSWLNFLLFGYIIIWCIDLLDFIILMASGSSIMVLNAIALTLIFIFANVIVYRGLKQPQIFTGIEEKLKYEASPLTAADVAQHLKKVTAYMKFEKPYLDPALSLTDLANQLSIPARQISQIINQSLHKNFFNFVNSYRIEDAKRYLTDHLNGKKTVLEILYEVGFNSKSSFNNIFKKYTGMTPTEFRRVHNKNYNCSEKINKSPARL